MRSKKLSRRLAHAAPLYFPSGFIFVSHMGDKLERHMRAKARDDYVRSALSCRTFNSFFSSHQPYTFLSRDLLAILCRQCIFVRAINIVSILCSIRISLAPRLLCKRHVPLIVILTSVNAYEEYSR